MAHGSQDTAGRDIANLVAIGVLVHEGAGGVQHQLSVRARTGTPLRTKRGNQVSSL